MNIQDYEIVPLSVSHEPIDIEEVLKESRKQALNEVSFLNEVNRINKFLDKIKENNNLEKLEINDPVHGYKDLNLSQIFELSEKFSLTSIEYPEDFLGIPDNVCDSVRLMSIKLDILNNGMMYTLKRGDLLIRFDSGDGGEVYISKSKNKSKKSEELFLCSAGGLNYKIIGPETDLIKSKWVFISTNFLSSLAIFKATGIVTICAPMIDINLLSTIIERFPDKKYMLFNEPDCEFPNLIDNIKVVSSLNGISWHIFRDQCLTCDIDNGNETFKDKLRQAIKLAL